MKFTKIKHDVNGNPRYVVHFLECVPDKWKENDSVQPLYASTVKLMNKIGGRKFNNKSFGGGIVFQEYNTSDLEKEINKLKESVSA